MLILGIDPGSHVTGYAFLEQGPSGQGLVRVLEYGAIRAKTSDPLHLRLKHICSELDKRILEFCPTQLVMEESFFAKNARTALVLGHARGAILATAMRYEMEVAEFSPRHIKQAVTGTGAASKDRVASMMQHHLRLTDLPSPPDAADALAVAWTFLAPQGLAHRIQTTVQKPGRIATALAADVDILKLMAQSKRRRRR